MVKMDLDYNSFFWSTTMTGINFNTNKDDEAFSFDSEIYAIFDTGSSHLFLPSDVLEPVVLEIML